MTEIKRCIDCKFFRIKENYMTKPTWVDVFKETFLGKPFVSKVKNDDGIRFGRCTDFDHFPDWAIDDEVLLGIKQHPEMFAKSIRHYEDKDSCGPSGKFWEPKIKD